MSVFDDEILSAFLDGELPEAEADAVERALADDPTLMAQLEALMAADQVAQEAFAAELDEPVPMALAAAIQSAPVPANLPAPPSRRGGLVAAAVALALLVGGASGFMLGRPPAETVAAAPGWLTDIAEYHAVYATQVRHLVEVPAEEEAHIQTWLTATLGTDVTVPDLEEHALTFEGARLLVAAGRPVAQLIYTDASGRVVALCQIQSDRGDPAFAERTINAFDMVSWGGNGANFVVVTDEGAEDLRAIAETAAQQV